MTTDTQVTRPFLPALRLAGLCLVLLGLAYPALGVLVGQTLFSHQAAGSLIERDGRIVGSEIVGQPFAGSAYFVGRPSAIGYDPMGVGGSNLAPSNPELQAELVERARAYGEREGVALGEIPVDAITASGAGIDPHISPENAGRQVQRVARARGIDLADVEALVSRATEGPTLGLFGQPRVNVLALNLQLDARFPVP